MKTESLLKVIRQNQDKAHLNKWEREFLESIEDTVSKGFSLSEKQLKVLNRIDDEEDK